VAAAEHRAVVRALAAGDAAAAEAAVRENWKNASARLRGVIDRIGQRGAWQGPRGAGQQIATARAAGTLVGGAPTRYPIPSLLRDAGADLPVGYSSRAVLP
jgi:hypothetical protein